MEEIFNIVTLGLDPRIQTTFSPPLDYRLRGNDGTICKQFQGMICYDQ